MNTRRGGGTEGRFVACGCCEGNGDNYEISVLLLLLRVIMALKETKVLTTFCKLRVAI
jgi:hypothetical protein